MSAAQDKSLEELELVGDVREHGHHALVQLGLVTSDATAVADAVAEYEHVTTHESEQVLYSKSKRDIRAFGTLLGHEKGKVHHLGQRYGSDRAAVAHAARQRSRACAPAARE